MESTKSTWISQVSSVKFPRIIITAHHCGKSTRGRDHRVVFENNAGEIPIAEGTILHCVWNYRETVCNIHAASILA